MLNDNNTITVAACSVAALSFTYNAKGKWVGTHWKREGEGKLPQSARASIEQSEAALYFNPEGVLDFVKCHALYIERLAEYAALCDLVGVLNKNNGEPNEANKLKDLDGKIEAAWSKKWDVELLAVIAPALTLQDITKKAELIAVFCDPADGATDLERMVLDGLAWDLKTLLKSGKGA